MDSIGAEVGQKMRSAIKAKLTELGCYVDDELPDYVMVMVANKRTKSQMNEDLQLFLTTKTSTFVDWLQIVLKKLKEITVTNPDIYKRASKRKTDDAHLNVKVKKEKKDKSKSNKKAKRKDVKPILKEMAEMKSLTDNLPVEASKLSEMRKIVVMQENHNSNSNLESVNEDCFDIPPLSEVAISNENELVEIEKKIKSVKSRLGLQVASDSEDEDFINLKAEPEELFPNEQLQELKQKKTEEASARKIKIVRHSDSSRELNEPNITEYSEDLEEPHSPKDKNEHPRIVFEGEHPPKRQSVMERLGKRPSSNSWDDDAQKHKKISLASIRKQEEELLGLPKTKSTSQRNKNEESKKITRSNTPESHRESALKRLGVMSKVAVPPPKPNSESEDETVNKEVLSVIKVKPRVLPPSNSLANKNLLLKAVAEAQRSVAQTPMVGSNSKPDALFTKKYRERSSHHSSSRKLPDKEKSKIKHILSKSNKKEKREYDSSSDDDNLEYVPRPVKQGRRSSERLEYIPSSKEHSGDDHVEGSDGDPTTLPRQSKGHTFIITLDGIARQNKSPKKGIETDTKTTDSSGRGKERKLPSPIVFDKVDSSPTPSKLKQIPDKLPIVAHPSSLKAKEKCKYWPSCRLGEKCEFVHPNTPCKAFPQCKFGDKCLYIHPMCKFENSCTRKDCPYNHNSRIHASPAGPLQMCKFFPNCSNVHCTFYHPRPCKYGKYCKNQGECHFVHNFATKNNFTWRSAVKL
ncbi:hypothetical protein PPYR_07355 [Photinus pyralis]|uniref:Zinc finger CCCH domain-containing protein 14 n=1 Tax=Photinus pyralis TaxID=7054 RepID=A0A1Y1L7S0_PHOPY|nr:zinc finger CCCH domain-containing protein 14 [Photinus pyralis]KAB0799475.1 hypothetical protein PPYR_07355 [Photinus pyralis]